MSPAFESDVFPVAGIPVACMLCDCCGSAVRPLVLRSKDVLDLEGTVCVQEVVSEQHNRKDFLRLYPRTGNLTERSSESSSHNENDALLAAWLLEKCVVDSSWC